MAENTEPDFGFAADMSVRGPLDGTIVTAVVGGNSSDHPRRAREYHVHHDLLSPLLKRAVNEATHTLQLPDESPATFNLFMMWLYPRIGKLPRVPDLSRYVGAGESAGGVAVIRAPTPCFKPTPGPQQSIWGPLPPTPLPPTPPIAADFIPFKSTEPSAEPSFKRYNLFTNICAGQEPWVQYSQEEIRLHYRGYNMPLASRLRDLRAKVLSLRERRATPVIIITPKIKSPGLSTTRASANTDTPLFTGNPGRALFGTPPRTNGTQVSHPATREAVAPTLCTLNVRGKQGATTSGSRRRRCRVSNSNTPTAKWEDFNVSTVFNDEDDGDDNYDDDGESSLSPNIPGDVAWKAEEVQSQLLDLLLFAEAYVVPSALFKDVFDAFVEGERRIGRSQPPLEYIARCGRYSREAATKAEAKTKWAHRGGKEFVITSFMYDWACARAMDDTARSRYAKLLRRDAQFAAGVLRRIDDALETSTGDDDDWAQFSGLLAGDEHPLDPNFRHRYHRAYPSYLGPRE